MRDDALLSIREVAEQVIDSLRGVPEGASLRMEDLQELGFLEFTTQFVSQTLLNDRVNADLALRLTTELFRVCPDSNTRLELARAYMVAGEARRDTAHLETAMRILSGGVDLGTPSRIRFTFETLLADCALEFWEQTRSPLDLEKALSAFSGVIIPSDSDGRDEHRYWRGRGRLHMLAWESTGEASHLVAAEQHFRRCLDLRGVGGEANAYVLSALARIHVGKARVASGRDTQEGDGAGEFERIALNYAMRALSATHDTERIPLRAFNVVSIMTTGEELWTQEYFSAVGLLEATLAEIPYPAVPGVHIMLLEGHLQATGARDMFQTSVASLHAVRALATLRRDEGQDIALLTPPGLSLVQRSEVVSLLQKALAQHSIWSTVPTAAGLEPFLEKLIEVSTSAGYFDSNLDALVDILRLAHRDIRGFDE